MSVRLRYVLSIAKDIPLMLVFLVMMAVLAVPMALELAIRLIFRLKPFNRPDSKTAGTCPAAAPTGNPCR